MAGDFEKIGYSVASFWHRFWSSEFFVVRYIFVYGGMVLSLAYCATKLNQEDDDGFKFTTICNDGTTSLSEGSGACSSHGGVRAYVPREQRNQKMQEFLDAVDSFEPPPE